MVRKHFVWTTAGNGTVSESIHPSINQSINRYYFWWNKNKRIKPSGCKLLLLGFFNDCPKPGPGFPTSYEEFEDTKESTNRQHNGQKKKNKRTNNDLQNITQ